MTGLTTEYLTRWPGAMDLSVPDNWWKTRREAAAAIGYRRRCAPCGQMRRPEVRVYSRWFRRSRVYQVCPVCQIDMPGEAMTGTYWFDGLSIHLRLRGRTWWVYEQVTLESLRHCPDVRGAADLLWSRMESEGLLTEAKGARR